MSLKLTVYKNENMTEVERVIKVDEPKISYGVVMSVMKLLEVMNPEEAVGVNTENVFEMFATSAGAIDKIIKATFDVSDEELEKADVLEVLDAGVEIVRWAVKKVKEIGKGKLGNALAAAKKTTM